MDLRGNWSEKRYKLFLEYLKNFSDEKYKKFHIKIVNDDTIDYIGIRTPVLRKIAKNIAKYDYQSFLRFNTHKFYEERAIHGFIISYAKINYATLIEMLKDFIPYISNWALTDLTATKFKQIVNNKQSFFKEILKFIKSSNFWKVRLGLVLILNIYVENEYIDKILKICKSINKDHPCCKKTKEIPYYVKIGNAWLLSECYVKFINKTEELFKEKTLEKWTQNKSIQKIRESFRIDKDLKEKIANYKI